MTADDRTLRMLAFTLTPDDRRELVRELLQREHDEKPSQSLDELERQQAEQRMAALCRATADWHPPGGTSRRNLRRYAR